jgi:hypothetical protein
MQARLRLSEYALGHSLQELVTNTLDEAESLTGSTVGFFHFLQPDQPTLSMQVWSTNTFRTMSSAQRKVQGYPVEAAGAWGDCLRQR